MIKINVLNTKVSAAGEDMQLGQGISVSNEVEGLGNQKDLIVKVMLMLVPLAFLYIYEYTAISELELVSSNLNAAVVKQQGEIARLTKAAGKAPEYEGEARKLEEKLNILMGLSKKRLRELKALDYLQNILPDGVWMQNVDYDGQNIKFRGGALNDKDLSGFVTSLETSNYFQNVIVLKAMEKRDGRKGYKEFEISSILGEFD